MREQLEARLAELEAEIVVGEQRWREVDAEQARLRETLMRMSGAIQVLQELLEEEASDGAEGERPDAEEDAVPTPRA
jgi:predicted nuclease with TOPRIM domain